MKTDQGIRPPSGGSEPIHSNASTGKNFFDFLAEWIAIDLRRLIRVPSSTADKQQNQARRPRKKGRKGV